MNENITGEEIENRPETRPNRVFSDLWNHRHDKITANWVTVGVKIGTEYALVQMPTRQALGRFLEAASD